MITVYEILGIEPCKYSIYSSNHYRKTTVTVSVSLQRVDLELMVGSYREAEFSSMEERKFQ